MKENAVLFHLLIERLPAVSLPGKLPAPKIKLPWSLKAMPTLWRLISLRICIRLTGMDMVLIAAIEGVLKVHQLDHEAGRRAGGPPL